MAKDKRLYGRKPSRKTVRKIEGGTQSLRRVFTTRKSARAWMKKAGLGFIGGEGGTKTSYRVRKRAAPASKLPRMGFEWGVYRRKK